MIREILIKPVLNGFICTVGCQLVVFQSASEMVREIEAYYKNPGVMVKAFMAKAVNKMSDGPLREATTACSDVMPCSEVRDSEMRDSTAIRRSAQISRFPEVRAGS